MDDSSEPGAADWMDDQTVNTIAQNSMEILNASLPTVSADWGGRGCRVIGCTEDIYSQKPVNLKYRLCKTHKSANALLVNGVPKRFCSQCSTFKHVDDFKGMMRACRPCLSIRSKSRNTKRDFIETLITGCPTPADAGPRLQHQQQTAAPQPSPAISENAQMEAFMAGAALAELLRNIGDNEPYATAAAMATAAATRGTATGQQQHHQQQQQLPSPHPVPPRIISTTNTTNLTTTPALLQPTVPRLTSEIQQQESSLAALGNLLAAANMPTTTTNTTVPGASKDVYAFHHGLLENPANSPLLLPQQQHQQPLPRTTMTTPPSTFQALVESYRRQNPTSSLVEASSTITKELELKRQRVVAELHLAKTNLELAKVEEEIYKLRYRQQIQRQQAAAAAASGGRFNDPRASDKGRSGPPQFPPQPPPATNTPSPPPVAPGEERPTPGTP